MAQSRQAGRGDRPGQRRLSLLKLAVAAIQYCTVTYVSDKSLNLSIFTLPASRLLGDDSRDTDINILYRQTKGDDFPYRRKSMNTAAAPVISASGFKRLVCTTATQ